MNVEAAATKGGYVLIERVVSALEKLADSADRAVRLAEYKQDRRDMGMLELPVRSPEAMAEALVRQKQFRERHR
jgi:hypothetical protein